MSGTHRDLWFLSQRRCFAWKNHRWGLRPIETCNSGANHDDLHAQSDKWGLRPIETYNSVPKVAVLHAQNNRWGKRPIETSNSGANHAVLHAQNDRWGPGPIETCNSDAMHAVVHAKTTGHVWYPLRLVILFQMTLFGMEKPQVESGTHRDL